MPFSHPLAHLATRWRRALEVQIPGHCTRCPVRRITLCGVTTDDELPRLEAHSQLFDLRSEATLFCQGNAAGYVYIVLHGCLRLTLDLSDGRRQVLGFPMPGECFGFTSLAHYDYGASTVTASRVCRIPVAAFRTLLREIPSLQDALLKRHEAKLLSVRQHVTTLGRTSAVERVAGFLLELESLEHQRHPETAPAEVPLPMTRLDVADHLGLTLETVSRIFTGLRRQGLIELRIASSAFIICNRPDLMAASMPMTMRPY